ncbi:preprotein translocase subunit SecA [Patescibacteria group bacterium]|nr:preprotein translocase subunit SecA [Patescibacteria group bacterium]MBU0879819.1 preprotein translocase subunit SecA [Patescibacteria group bacterium]MBU0880234.1 preprotein translocase subunit SecA [Patescibacteria group bacterium]MBU1783361.1 preprotein translocase subunit SecA [Patescibacteria group bacterium]MBU1991774.1 preprotein translocase subunit SecA [Patescibacteria group bacterium]
MSIFTKIFGDPNEKIIKSFGSIVEKINELEKKYQAMSDEELRAMTTKFRAMLGTHDVQIKESDEKINIVEQSSLSNQDLSSGESDVVAGEVEVVEKKQNIIEQILEEILPDAFAVVREAARRTLGQRHFDVQLMGGIVLHRGQIVEMKTGEGKTLVATLAAYLNALPAQGVHVITVNDYLAKRDASWMGRVYNFLGLTVGCITHEQALKFSKENSAIFSIQNGENNQNLDEEVLQLVSRKEAYQCDITYGTNNEFGFDYLRDNMAPDLERMVQRPTSKSKTGLNYAVIDEVDSILIDEARTPLIISAPIEEAVDKYYKFAELVKRLEENKDYNIDEKMRAATLTEEGIAKLEKWLGVDNIYISDGLGDVHHIEQALKAMTLFKRDRDYVVTEGEVIIVDEFTGRLMQGRRYSEGLHQAIEAKEVVNIQKESQTLATVTFQNYFRLYKKLAGMTGTAITEAEEFFKIYKLETVVAPTNNPMARYDLNDLIYCSENGKFKAVIEEIKARHAKGQPVLVGTISIEKNEILGDMLEREGVNAQILNAKHHEKEASIISQAGKLGAVTIATNMAGRGVDIILGGKSASEEDRAKVVAVGGLHIIGTERHESRRIDNQLRGRAGRQGDPGSSQFYISTEDDLMRIFGGDKMKGLMQTLRVPEDMPIENKMISRAIESAQTKVEGNNFDTRKHLVEYDDVINKHRESIYRRRREILEQIEISGKEENKLSEIILKMIENEIEQVIIFHTAAENISDWNLEEIYQVVSTIFPVDKKIKEELMYFTDNGNKLDKVKARTTIIEHLIKLVEENYQKLRQQASQLDISWQDVEKSILLRSIDIMWVEHLDAMDHMRRGIGLRGYGQRDPLVEYKKEAYIMYNELNNLIQKQVVYSIFKVGDVSQSAMQHLNNQIKKSSMAISSDLPVKDASGHKVGRNDLCLCGSGKKYKKCCGR